MSKAIAHKRWAIAEGYIPSYGSGPEPEFISHETACILSTSDQDAHVKIWVYYTNREPVGLYEVTVQARRVQHVRLNDLKDPEPIPRHRLRKRNAIGSNVSVVVQRMRLDSRQAENILLSTVAFSDSK